MNPQSNRVYIFDTTLRDGEQGAGASMRHGDKLKIARQLDSMGVDVIEAGFPAASKGAYTTVRDIARQTKSATVCALARGKKEDIDAACDALSPAGDRSRVHIFIATDKDHMAVKLKLSPEAVLESISEHIRYTKTRISDIEFSPEVATTTDRSFLFRAIETAIASGATTINIPDTTGYSLPREYGELVSSVKREVRNIDSVRLSVHCHDDRGLATANSLEGLLVGARQVECTVNGIGERAGNASLEEVLMALTLRPDVFKLSHSVDVSKLVRLSQMVEKATGLKVAPNKAFIGRNAFAHESGIHQDGVLKQASLYEICTPEMVGGVRRLPMGKLSGRRGLEHSFERLGYDFSKAQVDAAYHKLMAHADTHNAVGDEVLHHIAGLL